MTNTKLFNFILDNNTEQILNELVVLTQLSKAEIIRRGLQLTRVLMDPRYRLQDIVTEKNWNKSLPEILIPIPILKQKLL